MHFSYFVYDLFYFELPVFSANLVHATLRCCSRERAYSFFIPTETTASITTRKDHDDLNTTNKDNPSILSAQIKQIWQKR